MPPSLRTLPYEVISYVVDYIGIEDVTSLARTCWKFQYLEREENICRKLLETKLPHCQKIRGANGAGGGFASAFRRITKRHESVASASPYSVAILGICDHYLYCHGVLCYTLDVSLRIIDLHRSHGHETVINIPKLLRRFLPDPEEDLIGKFRILYYNEGIISCLYKLGASGSVAHLIVFDLEGRILLTQKLDATEKIFVRHNSKFLFYGIYTGDINDRHKKWVMRGYQLQQKKWFDQKIYLPELIGSDIGATVCFEIIGDYLYALSNQTTSDVEEVDWTSFYHCARFPIRSPCKELIENTLEDKHMWRRQHREGPIDDRWATLSLHLDEVSGDINIVETRREFTLGASTGRRTCYRTKVVFPEKLYAEMCESSLGLSSNFSPSMLSQSSSSSHSASMASSSSSMVETSTSPTTSPRARTRLEKNEWVAATNDRLALTLTASDNPHWFPPQPRLPRNVHPSIDGSFVLSQTPLRYYNASASSFVDLVDDRLPDQPDKQRLRIRIGSRHLVPPPRRETVIKMPENCNPLPSSTEPGYDDTYLCREPAIWPPDLGTDGISADDLDIWYSLLNPSSHQGKVEGTADSHSLLYVTGNNQLGQPKAMVFVNFDPAIRLPGVQKWGHSASTSCPSDTNNEANKDIENALSASIEEQGSNIPAVDTKGKGKRKETLSDQHMEESQAQVTDTCLSKKGSENEPEHGTPWIWTEPAMYTAINRGFDFSSCRCSRQ